MSEQTPIPDKLAEVRSKISALKAEEEALRDILLADPEARIGGDYIAQIREVVSYRVKGKDLEKANPELFAKLANECVSQQVKLVKRPTE